MNYYPRAPGAIRRQTAMSISIAAMVYLLTAAYIDPGAGSLLFQAVIGGLVTIGFILKSHWRSLVAALRRFLKVDGPR